MNKLIEEWALKNGFKWMTLEEIILKELDRNE